MSVINIGVVGSSNSIWAGSYTELLEKDGFNVTNEGIGATNSIYGLINILNYNLIETNDLLIFEYCITDVDHHLRGLNNIDRVKQTLIYIITLCIIKKKKLLFIIIPIRDISRHFNISINFNDLEMVILYKNIIQEYNISYIDVYNLFFKKYGDNWVNYYTEDGYHLIPDGYLCLTEEIKNKIKESSSLDVLYNKNLEYKHLDFCNIFKISDYTKDYKTLNNSLVNLNYYEIKCKMKVIFTESVRLIALEYVCDIDSGYVEINNLKGDIIQKNTLTNEPFVQERRKQMAYVLTFNTKRFNNSNIFELNIITKKSLNNNLYELERLGTKDTEKENTTFKLVSILVEGVTKIKDIILN